jgi:hypothetical protein
MSATFFRYDNTVRSVQGEAISGAQIAVLGEPADTTDQPGSPLLEIYAAAQTNAPTITGATWLAGSITFHLSAIPADLLPDTYIRISAANPAGYDGIYQVTAVDTIGLTVTVTNTTNPGTYVGSATAETSALPNPLISDNLGNFFFYVLPGIVTVQIYDTDGRIPDQLVLGDQNIVAGGSGSVSSVALVMPGEFSVSGSPISTSGTLTVTKAVESANRVYAGPTSGGATAPTFRALVAADLPGGTGSVSSVALTCEVPAALLAKVITGSPITTSGTIDLAITLANQLANTVFAGATSGGSAQPAFRALVAADIPSIAQSQVTGLAAALALLAPLASPTFTGTVKITLAGVQIFANNAAAITGGLVAGDLYRTGSDPDTVCIVH